MVNSTSLKNNPDCKEVLDTYNNFTLGLNLATLAQGLSKAVVSKFLQASEKRAAKQALLLAAKNGDKDAQMVLDVEKELKAYGETKFGKDWWKSGLQGAGNLFKVGDNIIGKVIQKVRPGTNGKIAVIGRKMPGHVEDVAAALKAEGKQVEIFSEIYQEKNIFNIDGSNRSWKEIVDDFANKNNQYLKGSNGRILDSELPKTMMYKANKFWVDKLKAQSYTVIDMGYPARQTLPSSVFYDMELLNLFP